MYALPCNELLQKAPAIVAWLAAKTFDDQSLTAPWPWTHTDLLMYQQPWGWFITIIPSSATMFIGFILFWYSYKEKFGRKKVSNSRFSNSELDIKGC